MRSFVSFVAVLVAASGLAGCYDLSSDGPGPEDFSWNRSGASSARNDDDDPPAPPTPADSSATIRGLDPLPLDRSAEEIAAAEATTAPGAARTK